MDEELSAYKEVTVVAWSLGVFVATLALAGLRLPIVRAVAINGTLFPMHDTLGIPPKIFLGTLENLSEEGRKRFNRRMCGSREVLRMYEQVPSRPPRRAAKPCGYGNDGLHLPAAVDGSPHQPG